MKIFINQTNENWICDRFADEWRIYNGVYFTNNPMEADIVWLMASWGWNQLPSIFLQNKIVVTTIHHIDLEKFDSNERANFLQRDSITDFYHVPCKRTRNLVQQFTKKPIFVQPFWANQNIWFPINEKEKLRKEAKISPGINLIGSFQRDTEGYDLKTPKLSKGPDIFCDIVEKISERDGNVEVLLSGWRRQYVMNRLDKAKIKYHYYNLVDFETMNKLYNMLDLYVVSSRVEGGPQAIVECALTKIPIISTAVGLASYILSKESIYTPEEYEKAIPNIEDAYHNVQKYIIPYGFLKFNQFFHNIVGGEKK